MPFVYLYNMPDPPGQATVTDIMSADLKAAPDVVLVMGTSLAIKGIQSFLRELKKTGTGCKFMYVNREPPKYGMDEVFSHYIEGGVGDWASTLSSALRMDVTAPRTLDDLPSDRLPDVESTTCNRDQSTSQGRSEAEDGMCSGRPCIGDELILSSSRRCQASSHSEGDAGRVHHHYPHHREGADQYRHHGAVNGAHGVHGV